MNIPHGNENVVVFVLSSDYSGSTWVGYVLGSHRDSAFLGEYWRAWNPELRTPCSWCAAQGSDVCEVLDGVEAVPSRFAYDFAFSRIGKTHLLDSSKRVDWARQFTAPCDAYEVRFIHLIRDPRGWYESFRRRHPGTVDELLLHWLGENKRIRLFLDLTRVKTTTVFYEELAQKPTTEFEKLSNFVGMRFEPDALRYWEKVHHGFAANGASSLLFSNAPHSSAIPHFITGDDPFYEERKRASFIDLRWKQKLSQREISDVTEHPSVREFLYQYGRVLRTDGIHRVKVEEAVSAAKS